MLVSFYFFKFGFETFADVVVRLLIAQASKLAKPIIKFFVLWIVILPVASASATPSESMIDFFDFHNVCFTQKTRIVKCRSVG